ncbi:MAG: guanylate kinase [Saprospiraceae bacterium]|nr:guanylate kinase [Pyrinomonadaceae bacterium]
MTGNLIIISSPSGGGKGTLIKEILASVPDIGYSVSLTTRPQRTGEIDGRDYHFVSRDEFETFRVDGGFLEYAEVHGNFYGTSRSQTEKMTSDGKDVILEIDVQGAQWVLKRQPEAVSIFILPPSFEALTHRLTARATETPEQLSLRLRNSFGEVMQYTEFEYVVINDEVTAASQRLESIILGERQKRVRQTEVIQGILSSFDVTKHQASGEDN